MSRRTRFVRLQSRRRWSAPALLLLLCGFPGVLESQSPPSANQYAVVIGISQYKNLPDKQWLRFAHEDARLFANFLKSNRVGIPPENIKLLLNEEATTTNIKSAVGSWLVDRVGANDTIFIFFAGHGYVDRRNDGYLISYDTDPEQLYATAYSMRDLAGIVNDRLDARHLVMFTDACKSGYLGIETLGQTRALEHNRINDVLKEIVAENTAVKESKFILNAAGSFELSFEGEQWGGGHGVFTHHLLEALGGAADRNADGRITANEVFDYTREKVRRDTQDRQNPIVGSTKYSGDLVLAVPSGTAPPFSGGAVSGAAAPSVPSPPPSPPVAVTRGATAGALVVTSPLDAVDLEIDQALRGSLRQHEDTVFVLAPGIHQIQASLNGFGRDIREVEVKPSEQTLVSLEFKPIPNLAVPGADFESLGKRFEEAQELLATNRPTAVTRLAAILEALLQTRQRRRLTGPEQQLLDSVLVEYMEAAAQGKSTPAGEKQLQSFLQFRPAFFTPADWETQQQPPGAQSRWLGQLQVTTDVENARLTVDGEFLGQIGRRSSVSLLPGEHSIRVERTGFQSREETVVVAAGERQDRSFPLALERIQLIVLSKTPNLQVFIEEKQRGETEPLASVEVRLTPSLRTTLRAMLEQAKVSGPGLHLAVIPDLPVRSQTVPLRFAKDNANLQPRVLSAGITETLLDEIRGREGLFLFNRGELIALDPMAGTLEVGSPTAGATILLDAQKIGVTPLKASVGVGKYQMVVLHDLGKFTAAVEIKPNETVTIQAELKPHVAFLGVLSPELAEERLIPITRQMNDLLRTALGSYILESPNLNRYEYWKDFVALASRPVSSEDDKKKILVHLQQMKERYGAHMMLFGYFPTQKDYLAGSMQLYLFSPQNPKPDVHTVEYNATAQMADYARRLDARSFQTASLFRGWIGLRTVDTKVVGHELIVVQVLPFSPGEAAGLKPGARIVSVDGKNRSSLELYELVQTKAVGETIAMEIVENDSARKTVTIKIDPIPALLSPESHPFLLNSLFIKLQSILLTSPRDSLEFNLALLNMALAHIQFGNWKEALESLTQIRLPEVSVAMVPAGLVEYLKGFCFESLGDKQLAIQAYRRARELKGSLMGAEYNEEARELANWRLYALQ